MLNADTKTVAMRAIIQTLRERMIVAMDDVNDAVHAVNSSTLNETIGILSGMEVAIKDLDALHRAAMVLHRS